ncbi:hypothetical protein ACFQ08_03935 [Streptosporangium algeriense]|uniref:Uncharacterized protein n=1 Tax=Streptosporangium algeriense TaxID=1682748 RepID=A0ABW3DIK3_9ACTN
MTTHHVISQELPKGVAVETYHEEDGTLVIVVSSSLSHAERRAAVASALRAARNYGATPLLSVFLGAGLRDFLAGPIAAATLCSGTVAYAPPIAQPLVVTVQDMSVHPTLTLWERSR